MSITVGQAKKALQETQEFLSDQAKVKETVENHFKALDKNGNGLLDQSEARGLIESLCSIMHLPPPTEADYENHMKLLDTQNVDKNIDLNEMGAGVCGALQHKCNSLAHFLEFAKRDNLGDDADLPRQ